MEKYMSQKELTLPDGIKEVSLVDLSSLGLEDDALNRVSAKINEAILTEYAITKKPSELIMSGIFGKKRPSHAGYMALDIGMIEKHGFKILDDAFPKILKDHNIK